MHIAIVRTEFIKARGGAERYAVNLAQQWLQQGHRISIVCAKHDPADARGMKVHTVSRPKLLGPFKHRWFAARAGMAARECGAEAVLCLARAYPGDVLRLGDGLHRSWLGARYPDLGQRRRALLNPRHRELMKLEQQVFLPGRFQIYVANSAMIRRAVVHMYGVDPARVLVIPNGVDRERFHIGHRASRAALRSRHGIPSDVPLLLFSGMDFRRKGLEQAVRGFLAFAADRKDAHFACVGPGDARPFAAIVEAAGLTRQAHWLAQTDALGVGEWYAAADVFLLPSMHDPSANAVTECLACGTPVITSNENGARQHISAARNGFVLHDRTDAAELASRVAELIDNPPDSQQVAATAGLISATENADQLLQALVAAVRMRAGNASSLPADAGGGEWHHTAGAADTELQVEHALRLAAWLGDRHRRGYRGLTRGATGDGRFSLRFLHAPGDSALDLWQDVKSMAPDSVKQLGRPGALRALKSYLWALGRPEALRDVLHRLR